MSLWKVQAGLSGQEEVAIRRNVVALGWDNLPDLSAMTSRDELVGLYRQLCPEKSTPQVISIAAQVWIFRGRMQVNDLVVVPLRSQAALAIGRIASEYEYRIDLGANIRHTRRVKWLSRAVPRSDFDQDLLYSFRAAMAVCQVTRDNAENRVEAIARQRGEIIHN